jgi:hypothetical protein
VIRTTSMSVIATTLAVLVAASLAVPAWGTDPPSSSEPVSPSSSPVGSGQAGPTPAASPCDPTGSGYDCWRSARGHAVSLVLASDPRFAGLPDYELLDRKARSELRPSLLVGSHYRVLSTDAELSQAGLFVYRTPTSWLIEVTLARGCVEPTTHSYPRPDPCGWRHSWYYRVLPDDSVTPLFDEGDPDDG